MKRRYVQDPDTLKLIEVTEGVGPDRRLGDAALWGDRHYDGLGTTDGVDISSRSKQRAYMKSTGLVDAGDFTNHFAKARKEQDAYHSGHRPTVTKRDLERTMYELNKGR